MQQFKVDSFKYGQVWLVKDDRSTLKNPNSRVQKKTRPMLIVSNDMNNKFSSTINVLAITSARTAPRGPYQMQYYWERSVYPQTVLCEQIYTIDKSDCLRYLYTISDEILEDIKNALRVQLNLLEK